MPAMNQQAMSTYRKLPMTMTVRFDRLDWKKRLRALLGLEIDFGLSMEESAQISDRILENISLYAE